MKLLLDTHAWLWFRTGSPRLGSAARQAILDPSNELWISVVSAWEIGVKVALAKLALPAPFELWLEPALSGFDTLPILLPHALAAVQLPPHHKDPFDRMLIAQASVDGLTLMTADTQIRPYGVPQLRADL